MGCAALTCRARSYPVTQEQWKAVMGSAAIAALHFPCTGFTFAEPTLPAVTVSWSDCQDFLERLNDGFDGGTFSLPTEAQWEYACRAGSTTRYSFGDEKSKLGKYAWSFENYDNPTSHVGRKKPNAWGLYDMHGNVSEWCADWYDEDYYAKSPTDDPTGPATGSYRVLRGGSWHDPAQGCRSAHRYSNGPEDGGASMGLRIVRVPAE
jgi:formylglycine-generating enzyme required for sulfatase activity